MKNLLILIILSIFTSSIFYGNDNYFINELMNKYNITEENALELENEFKNNNLTTKDQTNFINFLNKINKLSTNYINYDNLKTALDVYKMCKDNIEGTIREKEREMLKSFLYVITQNKNQGDSTKIRNLFKYQFKIKQENKIKYHKGIKDYIFEDKKGAQDHDNMSTNNQNNRNQDNRGRSR